MNEKLKWLGVIAITVCLTSLAWVGYGVLTAPEEDEFKVNWRYCEEGECIAIANCGEYDIQLIGIRGNQSTIQPIMQHIEFQIRNLETNETSRQVCTIIYVMPYLG